MDNASSNTQPRRFAIALSFPGERREFLSQVAEELANKVGKSRVLYDKYREAEFARIDLDLYLPNLYRTQSDLIAIFLCDEYNKKRWCKLEWRSVRQLISTADEGRIMFLSFDDVGAIPEIGILDGDGYVSIGNRSPQDIAALILERYGPLQRAEVVPTGISYDISRIIKYAPAQLIGREDELTLLNNAWKKVANQADNQAPEEKKRPHILTFVALGGEGKTSLVAKWVAELAYQNWPACDAAFAWSFYSQGTREQLAASSDLFLKEALSFFGDAAMASSAQGAFEKGRRLAQLVGERRALLILDGLEPLQYAPTSPTPGELKDQGIAALLKGLATASCGLCVVTTRYSFPDLKAFWQTTAPEVSLLSLSREAGVHLLKTLGVKGTAQECEMLVEDVKGHALTLTLLGGFLKRAFHGDIRQRDRVKFEKADEKIDGGHAFRTMAAYQQWLLRDGGDEGRREVAVLRLMGLFDRPANAGCLAALRSDTIPNLTEPLDRLADDDWEFCLSGLETAKLLTVNRDASGALVSLDAHPHLREYFAKQLRQQKPEPLAWRAAHRRLYEHLCATTKEGDQPTLEDLQPLYQAVAHGCQAGLQKEACDDVYFARTLRGQEAYSTSILGALSADLGAIACFFELPWTRISPALTEANQAWLLGESAFSLRALGRLAEAVEPLRATVLLMKQGERWQNAAIAAGNLSELELTLGDVAGAVRDVQQSVTHADRSGEAFERLKQRSKLANALHQAGRRAEAETRFREAEKMQEKNQPDYPLLYSLPGFLYCDLLLVAPERAAWKTTPGRAELPRRDHDESALQRHPTGTEMESCRAVSQRAALTLKWAMTQNWLLDIALNHLMLGRALLYAAILERSTGVTPLQHPHGSAAANDDEREGDLNVALQTAHRELDAAVNGLRRAGMQEYIPHGLLTRAWLRFLIGARTGPGSAQEDLEEAWEIAERGPMKLHMADIYLYRARLFGRPRAEGRNQKSEPSEEKYPWESPAADLAAAEDLIKKCGYHRRDEELADAKAALKEWEQR